MRVLSLFSNKRGKLQPADMTEEMVCQLDEEAHYFYKLAIRCIGITLALSIINIAALLVFIDMAAGEPNDITFTHDGKGYFERVHVYRNPILSNRQAVAWAKTKVTELLSLHFRGLDQQIEQRRYYFADDGWDQYKQSLQDNKTIEIVKNQGLVITAVNHQPPRLIGKSRLRGRTQWKIEIPVLQTIQGAANKDNTQTRRAFVMVEETKRSVAIDGLRILTFEVFE